MAQAVGEIRVDMALNSGQFATGIKQAQGSLSAFNASVIGFAAGIGTVIGNAMGKVASSIGDAFNRADDIGKMAQKIGMPVEELSRLQLAAKLSDVSMETLSASMGRLNRNMVEVANGGTGSAARAFKALGIEVKNADGSMKTNGQVLNLMADGFAKYADGAGKSALAMALLGRGGADMIPMLNSGSEAIEKAKIQAEQFGLVVTEDMKNAAEASNDNVTRLGAAFEGLATIIAGQLAPWLEKITNQIIEWIEKAGGAEGVAEAIGSAMQGLAVFVAQTVGEFQALIEVGKGVWAIMQAIATSHLSQVFSNVGAAAGDLAKNLAEVKQNTQNAIDIIKIPGLNALGGGKSKKTKPQLNFADNGDGGAGSAGAADKRAREIERAEKKIADAGQRVWEQTRTPMEKYANEIGRLQDLLYKGAITQDTFGRAVAAANEKYNKSIISMKDIGDTLENSLGDMWGDFIDGTLDAGEAIKNLGKSMLKMLGNKLIGSFMDSLFGGAKGGAGAGGGFLGGIMKAIGLPGFAAGGDFTGGKSIIVGERGPEIITPRVSGTVIPNHELGGPSSGGQPIINVVNNTGAKSEQRSREGAGGVPIIDVVIGEIARDVATNGRFAQTMQGMYGMSRTAGRR